MSSSTIKASISPAQKISSFFKSFKTKISRAEEFNKIICIAELFEQCLDDKDIRPIILYGSSGFLEKAKQLRIFEMVHYVNHYTDCETYTKKMDEGRFYRHRDLHTVVDACLKENKITASFEEEYNIIGILRLISDLKNITSKQGKK